MIRPPGLFCADLAQCRVEQSIASKVRGRGWYPVRQQFMDRCRTTQPPGKQMDAYKLFMEVFARQAYTGS